VDGKIKVKLILGSTRQGRFGEKPARWLFEELKKDTNIEVELLDLRDYPMPFFDEADSTWYSNGDYVDPAVQKWAKKINDGDAFIIVTPEYNHGYPGVLKNALDSISGEWATKPVGFVGYGSALGARAIEQLREVVIELYMVPIHNAIHIPSDVLMNARKGETNAFDPLRKGSMGDRVQGLVDQLVWYARVLKAARSADPKNK